jgi:hypothetical protein
MSEEDRQKEDDMQRVNTALETLSEHFETVQIFVTRHEGMLDGSVGANVSSGNWFARYGQVREWIIQQEERMKESIRMENR